MNNLNNSNNFVELSDTDLTKTNGGVIPVAVWAIWGAAGAAGFGAGVQVGLASNNNKSKRRR